MAEELAREVTLFGTYDEGPELIAAWMAAGADSVQLVLPPGRRRMSWPSSSRSRRPRSACGPRVIRDQVTIPARFNGPPGTANGGYACGLARRGDRAERVRAAVAPAAARRTPLERRRGDDGVVRLCAGETTIAEGRAARPAVDDARAARAPPPPHAPPRATPARSEQHPFPTCFVCGPLRPGRPAHLPRPGRRRRRAGLRMAAHAPTSRPTVHRPALRLGRTRLPLGLRLHATRHPHRARLDDREPRSTNRTRARLRHHRLADRQPRTQAPSRLGDPRRPRPPRRTRRSTLDHAPRRLVD